MDVCRKHNSPLVGLMFGYKFFIQLGLLTWTRSVTDFKFFNRLYILHSQSSQIATEAQTIVFPSVSQKNMLVIPNGINTEEFYKCEAERFEIRKSLGIDQKRACTPLRRAWDPMKGHDLILSLAETFPQTIFIIVGQGTEYLKRVHQCYRSGAETRYAEDLQRS